MLAITNSSMAKDICYGDQACLSIHSPESEESRKICANATTEAICEKIENTNGSKICDWEYTGKGFEYDLLVGPIFIVIFTFSGIFLGIAADLYNRKLLLGMAVIFWSLMTILTGLVKQYWQLILLRIALGIGEAGCTPFAVSLIGEYFSEIHRGTALGIYNWGIYMGYSMSYAIGNFITERNILNQGWRWSYYICGIPGVFFGILILLTVKEPSRSQQVVISNESESDEDEANEQVESLSMITKLKLVAKNSLQPSLLMLYIAGSVRNASGYVFGYYAETFYENQGRSKDEIGMYMSWTPLIGGSLSVLLGGYVADKVVKKFGLIGRIGIIIISLLCASPFAAGALYFKPPGAYISLIPAYLIGEMWISITLAVIVDLVPAGFRTSSVALYLFIITNIGGNAPLLVTPIQNKLEAAGYTTQQSLRGALYILYPGTYVLGSILFLFALFTLRHRSQRAFDTEYIPVPNEEPESNS